MVVTLTSPYLRASPLSHHCPASLEDFLGVGMGSLQPTGVIRPIARLIQGLSNPTSAYLAEPSSG